MRMLWDRYPEMPYVAVVRWPMVEYRGQWDFIASVDCVETWLERRIGPHWVRWTWNMWSLHQKDLCGVGFKHEQDVTLFLLRWDSM